VFIDQFVSWANSQLDDSERAQEYLLGRGISKNQWAKHKIGFVGGEFDVDQSLDPGHGDVCMDREKKHLWCDSCHYQSWSSTWESVENEEKKVRIVGRRIINNIVFPITSYSGNTIGFQIRSLERKEHDTFAIRRRPEGYFFGIGPNMETIWNSREIVLVEGPSDQLIMERLVRPDVVALTTSGASVLQIKFLKRFVRKIYLCLDLDKPGREGVQNFIKHYGFDFDIVNVRYQHSCSGKDCNDIWSRIGDDAFRVHMLRCFS
jgi:DNA primase